MKKVAILVLLAATFIACQSTENKPTESTIDSTVVLSEVDSLALEPATQDTFTVN